MDFFCYKNTHHLNTKLPIFVPIVSRNKTYKKNKKNEGSHYENTELLILFAPIYIETLQKKKFESGNLLTYLSCTKEYLTPCESKR